LIKIQNTEQLQDRELRDGRGRRIGRIRAVACSTNDRYAAEWALVAVGRLRRVRLVPLHAAQLSDDGSVYVPYPRRFIRTAPVADDHDLADAVAAYARHYQRRR